MQTEYKGVQTEYKGVPECRWQWLRGLPHGHVVKNRRNVRENSRRSA